MKRAMRLVSLMLCILLLAGLISPAGADVVTLGVYFTGMIPEEDGSFTTVKLSGSFRILQNGEDMGAISAGGETLTLNSTERIRIEPLPETIAPEWDLGPAYQEVTAESGGTTIIPITVYRLEKKTAAESAETQENAETPAGETQAETEQPAENNGEETEPEGETEAETAAKQAARAGTPAWETPTLPAYIPMAEATPEPILIPLEGGEGTGRIHVCVFNDKNGNGVLGTSEFGVEDMTVYLLNEAGQAVAVGVTDADGMIEFDNLPEGTYQTRMHLPESWGFTGLGQADSLTASAYLLTVDGEQTSMPVSVTADRTTLQGIGICKAPHVSGMCWLENTVDGLYRGDDVLLPGVRVTLDGQKNGLHYETTSTEDGSWFIDRVRPGFYTLTVYVPDGMMFTKQTGTAGKRSIFTRDGVTKAAKTLDLNDRNSKEDQNVGFAWAAQVYGRCYLDANYNGRYDEGELPLKGVKMTAIKQLPDEEVAVTYSGEDGTFVLSGLRKNTYKIRAVLPEDGSTFTRVVKDDPLGNHFQARPDRRENFWTNFELGDMERREIAVGAIYPATVKGTVYMDNDFSGSFNGSEKIVTSYVVSLKDGSGQVVASDKTSIRGVYEITGLAPGEYTYSVTAVKGYAFTKTGEGSVILNLNNGEGTSEPFRVELGETLTGRDIGMIRPGTVTGTVFADRNDNGLRDGGEEGMTGTVVKLISEEGQEAFRAEIGRDGSYLFDAVMPGRYFLEYTIPEQAVFASVVSGGNALTGEGKTARTEVFSFSMGEERTAPLCGALTLGRIDGHTYQDHDGNGMQEGEETLAGMTITLTPSRNDLAEISVVTGEDGAFALENLRPDTYTLRFACPEGYVMSRTDSLALKLTAGKADQSLTLDVPMGSEWRDQAVGAVIPGAISGRVWMDENDNGLFDEGERTPSGYTVTILDESTGRVFDTPETDAEGYFRASGMIPGTFTAAFPLSEDVLAAKSGDCTFREENGQLVSTGIALRENETTEGLLLGFVQHTTISGFAWIDRGNGLEALSGASVNLTDGAGNVLQTVMTGESGEYRFAHLMPGMYGLQATVPEGCVIIEPGDPMLISGRNSVLTETVNRVGSRAPEQLMMAQDWTGMDIGCVLPGRLGDFCWVDLNGDGLQGAGEPGIPNVKIELMRDGKTIAETVTDQYGFYRFVDLYPAAYTLKVTAPKEVKPTTPRTDIRIIASVLQETEEEICSSNPVTVESNRDNFNADLGFVCRTEGVLPAGAGEGKVQIWP